MQQKNFLDFANEWVHAWNSHDLDNIMSHYSDMLQFTSPLIKQIGINEIGTITNKAELKSYFEKGLQKYADLRFELYHVLSGVNSVVLFYKSVNNMLSAEYMELNEEGKVISVRAHYAAPQ